jgi:hypothetical protein
MPVESMPRRIARRRRLLLVVAASACAACQPSPPKPATQPDAGPSSRSRATRDGKQAPSVREQAADGAASRSAGSVRIEFDSRRPDLPWLFLWLGQGAPVSGITPRAGIIAAVMQDGRVARATSEENIGKDYAEGRITQEQIASLRSRIESSGIAFAPHQDRLQLDRPYQQMTLRTAAGVLSSFCDTTAQCGAGIDAIARELLSLPLTGATRAETEMFANYPDNWDD